MSASKITIRPATPDDAEALLSIYAPYVKHTAITFEYEVPSVEEFRERIIHTLKLYPYLVAQQETGCGSNASMEIVGYAYAGPLHPRAAYAWSGQIREVLPEPCVFLLHCRFCPSRWLLFYF